MDENKDDKCTDLLADGVMVTHRTVNADDKSSNLFLPAKFKKCCRCHETLEATAFYAHRRRKDGLQSYCKECMSTFQKELTCSNCHQPFFITHRNIHKRKTFLCSACTTASAVERIIAQNKARKKESVFSTKGYLIEHKTNQKGYFLSHRKVMELEIGRKLVKTEVVHHIDGDRINNSIENLFLTNHSGHINAHANLDKIAYELVRSGVIVFDRATGTYSLKKKLQ